MSPVWNHPSSNALAASRAGADVSGRDVVAANEDLAVRRDLHLDAGDGLSDRSAPGAERMVERDDRRGLGEAVALDHGESHLAPERLELGLERRRAHDERPELPAEDPMDVPVVPPAAKCAREDVALQADPFRVGGVSVPALLRAREARPTYSLRTSRIFGTDTRTDTRRDLICAAMSAGL